MSFESVTIAAAGSLPAITMITHPGRQSVTPASIMAVEAIGRSSGLLHGRGIDWGAGTGLLSIGAALLDGVDSVVGLELDDTDLSIARINADRNGVGDATVFVHADSYRAVEPDEQPLIDHLRNGADFIIANPPASRTGDGLDWRREALRGGLDFLVPGAPVFIQISYQYSLTRIEGLVDDVPGYAYEGVGGTTDWVPFDQSRADLANQLLEYARVEAEGGIPYTFSDGRGGHTTATEASERYQATGESPLSKWQMHRYRRLD